MARQVRVPVRERSNELAILCAAAASLAGHPVVAIASSQAIRAKEVAKGRPLDSAAARRASVEDFLLASWRCWEQRINPQSRGRCLRPTCCKQIRLRRRFLRLIFENSPLPGK